MSIAKKRSPPLDANHKRASSMGEVARLQKEKKWKAAASKPRRF